MTSASTRPSDVAPAGRAWWRPHRIAWWIGALFVAGSVCFAVASVASQWASAPRPAIGVTFFVGSIFFTAAAYLQFSKAVNVMHGAARRDTRSRWRPASWEPRRIDWLASLVQLVGTLFFNLSTFEAMKRGLDARQTNLRVWAPDAVGSVCFLLASWLAYAEVCHRRLCWQWRSIAWRIAALNLLGSVAFAIAAVASLVEPSSSEPVSAAVANAGTTAGALCFLVGALLLIPEAGAPPPARGAPAAG